MIKQLFGIETLKKAVPYLMLIIGLSSFSYSIFGSFENVNWQLFWKGLGQTILAGGLFAILLKTIQYSGVFKEELEKLIFEPKFLNFRKDLPTYWEKVSKELFNDKFSKISGKLLTDITEVYFPTHHSVYYDSIEHFIKITNPSNNEVEVDYTVKMDIICSSKDEVCSYDFSNTMSYKISEDEVEYELNELRVNGLVRADTNHSKIVDNNQITNTFKIELKDKEVYKLERHETKKYDLDNDNIMYFRANKITHKFTLAIEHPASFSVVLKKCGTINDFNVRRNTSLFKEYIYDGIMYPEQGYIILFKK